MVKAIVLVNIAPEKTEAEALSRLIFGKKLLNEYDSYNVPAYLSKI